MTYETKFALGDTAYECTLDRDFNVKTNEYEVLEIRIYDDGIFYVCSPKLEMAFDETVFAEDGLLTEEEKQSYRDKIISKLIADKEAELAELKKRKEELLNGN